MQSPVIAGALATLIIARQTGGDLSQTLETAATSLREMSRLEGVVRSKTAEGKGQVVVLAVVPFLMVALLGWIDPTWLSPLTDNFAGYVVVAIRCHALGGRGDLGPRHFGCGSLMPARTIGWIAVGCIGVALLTVTFVLGRNPPAPRPQLGLRGLKRKQALQRGGLFRLFEPTMRRVSGWMVGLPLQRLREKIHPSIMYSGEYLGLTPNDFVALTLISAVSMASVGLFVSYVAHVPSVIVVFGLVLGAALPYLQVQQEGTTRFKQMNRSLPTAIDLAALCMGAGFGFSCIDQTDRFERSRSRARRRNAADASGARPGTHPEKGA